METEIAGTGEQHGEEVKEVVRPTRIDAKASEAQTETASRETAEEITKRETILGTKETKLASTEGIRKAVPGAAPVKVDSSPSPDLDHKPLHGHLDPHQIKGADHSLVQDPFLEKDKGHSETEEDQLRTDMETEHLAVLAVSVKTANLKTAKATGNRMATETLGRHQDRPHQKIKLACVVEVETTLLGNVFGSSVEQKTRAVIVSK